MKIYKNPSVSREMYFVKTGSGFSHKNEAPKSNGYIIEIWDGKWNVRKGAFYDMDLNCFPVVAENRVSIQKVIDNAILTAVLELVKKGGVENDRD